MPSGGHNWRGGASIESTRFLDVMQLARRGHLSGRSGRWCWTYQDETQAVIHIEGGVHEIILHYRFQSRGQDWQPVRQPVPIRWTPCRLGGQRPWFVCDVTTDGAYCGRKVAKLYAGGLLFACRHCYRLTYGTQRGGPLNRLNHHLDRLLRKLGAEWNGPDRPMPAKPKGMRWRTYRRRIARIERNEAILNRVGLAELERLVGRVEKPKDPET